MAELIAKNRDTRYELPAESTDDPIPRSVADALAEAVIRCSFPIPISVGQPIHGDALRALEAATITDANKTALDMLGINGRQSLPIPARDVDGGQFVFGLLRTVAQDGFASVGKDFNATIRGQRVTCSVGAVPTTDDGRLTDVWITLLDLSDVAAVERHLVVALERQQEKIGRDLHDGLGQILTGLRIFSDGLVGSDGDRANVQKIASLADDAAREMRQIYQGLAPLQLFRYGLSDSLAQMAASLSNLPNVRCDFQTDGAEVEDDDAKLQLFRIAQEATNNAVKHGHCENIMIRLRKHGDGVVLSVEDDGVGMPPEVEFSDRSGLENMKYRARLIKAGLSIDTASGEGTRISCLFRPTV